MGYGMVIANANAALQRMTLRVECWHRQCKLNEEQLAELSGIHRKTDVIIVVASKWSQRYMSGIEFMVLPRHFGVAFGYGTGQLSNRQTGGIILLKKYRFQPYRIMAAMSTKQSLRGRGGILRYRTADDRDLAFFFLLFPPEETERLNARKYRATVQELAEWGERHLGNLPAATTFIGGGNLMSSLSYEEHVMDDDCVGYFCAEQDGPPAIRFRSMLNFIGLRAANTYWDTEEGAESTVGGEFILVKKNDLRTVRKVKKTSRRWPPDTANKEWHAIQMQMMVDYYPKFQEFYQRQESEAELLRQGHELGCVIPDIDGYCIFTSHSGWAEQNIKHEQEPNMQWQESCRWYRRRRREANILDGRRRVWTKAHDVWQKVENGQVAMVKEEKKYGNGQWEEAGRRQGGT